MPIEVETDEEKKASKHVQDYLDKTRELRSLLTTMKRHTQAPKITAGMGRIPREIHETNRLPQQDILSTLPLELQYMVWSYLTYPADRAVLALTCKLHASVFEELKGNISPGKATKKSSKAATKPKANSASSAIPKKNPTVADRLHVLYRLQSWMPAQYRLCCMCTRFRLKSNKTRLASNNIEKASWSGKPVMLNEREGEKAVAKQLKSANVSGQRCPECCSRAQLGVIAHKASYKQLKKEVGDFKWTM